MAPLVEAIGNLVRFFVERRISGDRDIQCRSDASAFGSEDQTGRLREAALTNQSSIGSKTCRRRLRLGYPSERRLVLPQEGRT
jgi:hypothetical protein